MTTDGCKGVYKNGQRNGCGKMPVEGTTLCPRCTELTNAARIRDIHMPKTAENRLAAQEHGKKQEARRAACREKEKQEAAFLASSPLAADNTEFGARPRPHAVWIQEHRGRCV
jgi:hypothetical protein